LGEGGEGELANLGFGGFDSATVSPQRHMLGFAIREVWDPRLSLAFPFRLAFNKWYVLALASALVASFLSYVVLREMGVLAGRLFLP